MTIKQMSTKTKRQKLDLSNTKENNQNKKSHEKLLHQARNEKWRNKGDTRQSLAEKEKERRKRKTEIESSLQKIISELTKQKYDTRIDAMEAVLNFLISQTEKSINQQAKSSTDFNQQTDLVKTNSPQQTKASTIQPVGILSSIEVSPDISQNYNIKCMQTDKTSVSTRSIQTLKVNVNSTQTQTSKIPRLGNESGMRTVVKI